MAKKQEDKVKVKGTDHGSRLGRYFFTLMLICVVVLAWLSLLTFWPQDPPSTLVASSDRVVKNGAGTTGAYIAYYLHRYLGGGAYMGLLFATLAGAVLIAGGKIREIYWRLLGTVMLMVATSTAIYLWNPSVNGDLDMGFAGVVGNAIGLMLSAKLKTGAWLIVGFSLAAGLMLTADNIVLQLPGLGKKVWAGRGKLKMPEFVSAIRIPTFTNPPATDSRTVTASPRAAAAAPLAAAKAASKAQASKASADKLADEPRLRVTNALSAKLDDPTAPVTPKASTVLAKPAEQLVKFVPAKPVQADDKPKSSPGSSTGRKEPYLLPSADLLAAPSGGYTESQEQQAEVKQAVLQQTLNDFGVGAEVVGHQTGPVITLFELSLAPGVKVAQVANLSTDVARALAVPGVRIVSPIPGKDTIGIEVPNMQKEIVRIRELMNLAPDAAKKYSLPLYLGKDAAGDSIVADLAGMPHMLIAGTTGSGKSVCINTIIMSILLTRSPEEAKLILVDPKMVEMAAFDSIPHLLCPVVNDMKRAEDILDWAATKMDERYELLKEAGVKNIKGFNALSKEEIYERFQVQNDDEKARVPTHLPFYVIIIDELADLIMTSSKEVEGHIIRIAQKARAVGIHLILATQRPSVNVVTGLIKSNMPCRISFRVASRQESRIVLDQNGADVLMGQGDMLLLQPGTSNLIRAQGTYVDDSEIRTVVETLKASVGEPQFNAELMRIGSASVGDGGDGERDELFDQGVEIVLASQRGSVSLLQRRLQVGYSRASRIIDQMADAGILGDYKGSQARECLLTLEDWQANKASIAADLSGESSANGEPTSS
jgi:S-DNA-T family DNA segregation ATPase FtsK/SpoIIIE